MKAESLELLLTNKFEEVGWTLSGGSLQLSVDWAESVDPIADLPGLLIH